MNFTEILNINTNYNTLYTVYKYLLAAFLNDYLHNTKHTDKDKILFAAINDDNYDINNCETLQEAASILQKLYISFNHNIEVQTKTFILTGTNLAQVMRIPCSRALVLHKHLKDELKYYKDIYIILDTSNDEFDMTVMLNDRECKIIKSMLKAALTSTDEYLCTDIILYKGNDTDMIKYSHVVYYNILDNTLIEDNERDIVSITKLLPPDNCQDFADYVEKSNSHIIYVPCILHYQKIQNNALSLGLTGNMKDYISKRSNRIQFVKNIINTYSEKWYLEKRNQYLKYLDNCNNTI